VVTNGVACRSIGYIEMPWIAVMLIGGTSERISLRDDSNASII
jgi:hypothetical protein